MKKVTALLAKAKAEDLCFDIIGYQASDGIIHNYKGLKFAGHDGYLRLVRESVDWAARRAAYVPGWCDSAEVWAKSVEKQSTSWLTTLNGDHGRKQQELKVSEDGSYAVDKGRPELVILKSLELTGDHTVTGDDGATRKEPKSMEAKCTAFLRTQAPVRRFIGQLNLAPGKFLSIKLCPPPAPAES